MLFSVSSRLREDIIITVYQIKTVLFSSIPVAKISLLFL